MPDFSVVGIGASAGGIDAFHSFFDHMPADCGMAFVMVLHLPSGRKSMLTEILAREMPAGAIATGAVNIVHEALGKSMTLIALTGWGQESDRRRAHVADFDHHLTKPIDPDQLERLFEKNPG